MNAQVASRAKEVAEGTSSIPMFLAAAAAILMAIGLWNLLPGEGGDSVNESTAAMQSSNGEGEHQRATAESNAAEGSREAPNSESSLTAKPTLAPKDTEKPGATERDDEAVADDETAANDEAAKERKDDSPKKLVKVTVRSTQEGVRFWERGKRAGTTKMVVEVEKGKRRRFEAGLTGYVTRKVVVDGTEPEIVVGLRPEDPLAKE